MAHVAINLSSLAISLLLLRKWAFVGEFDLILSKLRESVRMKRGQNREASIGIMDSQSVRCGNNRSLNGFDGNKKVKG